MLAEPFLRIDGGQPSDEELAALTVVLSTLVNEVVEPSVRALPARWLCPERRAVFEAAHSWRLAV